MLQKHGNDWRPVTYASRVLSESETRYAQIEKEALAIVFAREKFHPFVYGRRILVETDHRPPIAIAQKSVADMPPRLQRFFIRLFKYDYVLQFIPGKDLVLADMLSRTATLPGAADEAEDMEVHAIQVVSSLVSRRTKQRLQEETRADPYLSSVLEQLKAGATIQGELKLFTSELSAADGVLLKGSKIVVPKSMRSEILGRIHEGHMGQNKCKARARRLVFWPGLGSDIENLVRTCQVCQKYAYSQPSEPLLQRPTSK